jgi:acetyl-CoA C-acetyltransferase/acetyl-CoA acyltransferase
MTDAVIVSTARTPIGKAYRGALNNTEGATLLGHAISSALSRAEIDPAEVEDVVMGCAMQQGTTGTNIARKALLRAGLPVTTAGTTIDRQCASGLQAIALAARSVIFDGVEIAIGGGGESISLVQNNQMNTFHAVDPELLAMKGDAYMAMLDTAEIVAKRYDISRERQDEYSLESQRRTASARQGGRFNDELAPIKTTMAVTDKTTGAISYQVVTLSTDEGPRPDTTAEGLAAVKPAKGPGFTITGGNASQLSDGASAAVIMSDKLAAQKGLKPLGIFRGFVAAGCEPDEIGGRSGLRRTPAAQAAWIEDRRYRSVGVERGFCGAGDLLPRQARHRSGEAQRQRGLDRGRSSLWHDRGAPDRPRPDRGPAAQRQIRRRHHVRRRRHGRCGPA